MPTDGSPTEGALPRPFSSAVLAPTGTSLRPTGGPSDRVAWRVPLSVHVVRWHVGGSIVGAGCGTFVPIRCFPCGTGSLWQWTPTMLVPTDAFDLARVVCRGWWGWWGHWWWWWCLLSVPVVLSAVASLTMR